MLTVWLHGVACRITFRWKMARTSPYRSGKSCVLTEAWMECTWCTSTSRRSGANVHREARSFARCRAVAWSVWDYLTHLNPFVLMWLETPSHMQICSHMCWWMRARWYPRYTAWRRMTRCTRRNHITDFPFTNSTRRSDSCIQVMVMIETSEWIKKLVGHRPLSSGLYAVGRGKWMFTWAHTNV